MGLPAAVDGENEVYEVTVHPEAVGGDGPPAVPCKTEIFGKVYDPRKGQARRVLIGVNGWYISICCITHYSHDAPLESVFREIALQLPLGL